MDMEKGNNTGNGNDIPENQDDQGMDNSTKTDSMAGKEGEEDEGKPEDNDQLTIGTVNTAVQSDHRAAWMDLPAVESEDEDEDEEIITIDSDEDDQGNGTTKDMSAGESSEEEPMADTNAHMNIAKIGDRKATPQRRAGKPNLEQASFALLEKFNNAGMNTGKRNTSETQDTDNEAYEAIRIYVCINVDKYDGTDDYDEKFAGKIKMNTLRNLGKRNRALVLSHGTISKSILRNPGQRSQWIRRRIKSLCGTSTAGELEAGNICV